MEIGNIFGVKPDSVAERRNSVEYYDNPKQVKLSREIEDAITRLCQPYRNPNTPHHDMWLISPGYSELSRARFGMIQRQVRAMSEVYQFVNRELGSPLHSRYGVELNHQLPFYLRLDTLSLSSPQLAINAEIGPVPVGEGEVTAIRKVYNKLVAPAFTDVMPGSAQATVDLLKGAFGDEPIRIVLPPRRNGYLGDYRYVSRLCRESGLDVFVEDPNDLKLIDGQLVGKYGHAKVIYRGFQLSDLEDPASFAQGPMLIDALVRGKVDLYPQITYWDRKSLLGRLYQPELRQQLIDNLGVEIASEFYNMFPETWVCDPNCLPEVNGNQVSWSYFDRATAITAGYHVLKPTNGREARGLVFSQKVSTRQWQEALHDVLLNPGSYILQRDAYQDLERFNGTYYDREQQTMATSSGWLDRLCTNVFVSIDDSGNVQPVIGDIDHTLRRGTRLIHTASDAIHVPVYVH